METKFEGKEEKYKITVVAILLTSACFLTYYFHAVLGIGAFFTYFFYIPIILASLWWKRKGLIVAIFLAGFLIFSYIFFRTDAMTLNDYFRAFMFIVIALVVAILSEQIVKAEKKTKLAYAELNQIFHAAVDGMRVIDKHFNMVRVNQAFSTLSGISEGEAVGEKCYDLFHGPLCHTPSCLLTRILGGEERVECEVEKERTDGIRIPCILAATPFRGPGGELIGIVENLKDITERVRIEEALVKEHDLLRAFMDNTPDWIFFKDAELRFTKINKTVAELLGVADPKEALGKTDLDFFPRKAAQRFYDEEQKIIQSGQPVVARVGQTPNRDGEMLWVSETKIPLYDETGKVLGLAGISRDITTIKRAEEALIQSERIKALGEMAAGVAHDFNNLLAIILGNAQLLERGMERYELEEIKDRLKVIARTAEEGGKTVRRLQHFSQREVSTEDFTKLDLNKIVREAIASTSPRWKDEAEAKGIRIRIKEELGELPPLLGSRSELMEVLTNLIFNALDSMSEGGEITTRTEAKENEVLLYFTDTGKGVPDRIKGKIFDPFFTTKGPKASGLGLSICYGIIKRHRGKIKVKSSKGKGTTFTISIPVGLESKKR